MIAEAAADAEADDIAADSANDGGSPHRPNAYLLRGPGIDRGGDKVSWDDTAKQVVLPGTGMVPIGIATIAAGNGVGTVRVRLDGIATAAA